MRRTQAAALGAALIMVIVAGSAGATPPTPMETPTITPPPTDTPSGTETPTETPAPTETPVPTLTPTPSVTPTVTPTATPTMSPTTIPTETPTVIPTPTELPNYLILGAALENLDGVVRVSYRVDFGRYDFEGVPVNVYLAAVTSPVFSEGEPFGLDDLFAGGAVRLFNPDMSTYAYQGAIEGPTFRGVTFYPDSIEGSFMVSAYPAGIYRGSYAFAAVFTRADTGEFVRTDGMPVTGTGVVTPFMYHAEILASTIHVGDGYDPYMANWEVPYPEGITVERAFALDPAPSGMVVLRGGYWGTYYGNNPVYINGSFLTDIPGLLNGNHWAWSSGLVSPSRFRPGANLATFKCTLYGSTGHWDNYMAKGWELYYN